MIEQQNSLPFELSGDLTERINVNRLPRVAREFYFTTLNHKVFEQGLEAMKTTHAMSGLEGTGMIIEGEPGLGKTTLLNKYVRDIYAEPEYQRTDELTPLPILKIRIPGRPTIPRVIEKLLLTSNHIQATARKTSSLESRLHQLIHHQRVEMIIFDEYQHLLRSEAYTNDTLNFIKTLADDYKLAVVFAGLPKGRPILESRPELRERMSFEQVLFKPFNVKTKESSIEYAKYIKGLEEKIYSVGVDCCPLASGDMLPRLLLATQGKPRFINRLLMRLLIQHKECKSIKATDFARVFSNVPFNSHLGKFNPFSAKMDKVILKIGE